MFASSCIKHKVRYGATWCNGRARSKQLLPSENQAITQATCQLIWLKNMLHELRFHRQSMNLAYDNQAAVHIAANQYSMRELSISK